LTLTVLLSSNISDYLLDKEIDNRFHSENSQQFSVAWHAVNRVITGLLSITDRLRDVILIVRNVDTTR